MIYIIIYLIGFIFSITLAAFLEAEKLSKSPYGIDLQEFTWNILWYVFWPIGIVALLFKFMYFGFLIFFINIFKYMEKK